MFSYWRYGGWTIGSISRTCESRLNIRDRRGASVDRHWLGGFINRQWVDWGQLMQGAWCDQNVRLQACEAPGFALIDTLRSSKDNKCTLSQIRTVSGTYTSAYRRAVWNVCSLLLLSFRFDERSTQPAAHNKCQHELFPSLTIFNHNCSSGLLFTHQRRSVLTKTCNSENFPFTIMPHSTAFR